MIRNPNRRILWTVSPWPALPASAASAAPVLIAFMCGCSLVSCTAPKSYCLSPSLSPRLRSLILPRSQRSPSSSHPPCFRSSCRARAQLFFGAAMADKEEDVQLGATKYGERVPLGTGPQHEGKDYKEPPPAPFFDGAELTSWSLWRAAIAEFVASLLFLYITINTVIGHSHKEDVQPGSGAGIKGIAWAFGATIFVLVYSTAGISGGHINPAVTFGLFLARKVSLPRFLIYVVAQSLGAIAGAGLVKGWQSSFYERYGGGANSVNHGYTKGSGLGAEIVGTFVLVYTVFSATDAKRNARDSHVPVLAPLPIGFAVFLVHLATIPITGTGINPARSFGAAVIFDESKPWHDHWIFWVGPFLGAAIAAAYHQFVIRAIPFKSTS